ncbi:hypothetical protein J2776_003106 [Paraburkholderia caledonica]|uniref:Transposase zinc-binding domain-containing protein n=1 Tax=Paraburkholderia caledonica TaxID=134536 RepID=A0ABU1KZL5_9BURK|nr:hypothetical protein [Paraburkholderia caledonica]
MHLPELPERERNEEASEATAALALRDFVEDMNASGFVADALARCGIAGASVAPACGSGMSSFGTIGKRKCPLCAVGADESPSFERINALECAAVHSRQTLSQNLFAIPRHLLLPHARNRMKKLADDFIFFLYIPRLTRFLPACPLHVGTPYANTPVSATNSALPSRPKTLTGDLP